MSIKQPQSRDDLIAHLRDQMAMLKASAEAFDQGDEFEAKRLASTIRTLVVESPKSLLTQLGTKEDLRYLDTSVHLAPGEVALIGPNLASASALFEGDTVRRDTTRH